MIRVIACLFAFVLAAPAAAQNLANPAALNEQAPATYKVQFDTSKGAFVIEVHRADRAPNGADRFYNLVRNGFYDNARFFRVVTGFMVQFGINGDPKLSSVWREARIKDDAVKQSNGRGYITFATAGPDTRTTQVFINFADNAALDRQGFAPFGKVVSGMTVVDALYADYGEGAPRGRGPSQQHRHSAQGNGVIDGGVCQHGLHQEGDHREITPCFYEDLAFARTLAFAKTGTQS